MARHIPAEPLWPCVADSGRGNVLMLHCSASCLLPYYSWMVGKLHFLWGRLHDEHISEREELAIEVAVVSKGPASS